MNSLNLVQTLHRSSSSESGPVLVDVPIEHQKIVREITFKSGVKILLKFCGTDVSLFIGIEDGDYFSEEDKFEFSDEIPLNIFAQFSVSMGELLACPPEAEDIYETFREIIVSYMRPKIVICDCDKEIRFQLRLQTTQDTFSTLCFIPIESLDKYLK